MKLGTLLYILVSTRPMDTDLDDQERKLVRKIKDALIVMCLQSDSTIPYRIYPIVPKPIYYFIRCRWYDVIYKAGLTPSDVIGINALLGIGDWVDSSPGGPASKDDVIRGWINSGVDDFKKLWPEWRRCTPGENLLP